MAGAAAAKEKEGEECCGNDAFNFIYVHIQEAVGISQILGWTAGSWF